MDPTQNSLFSLVEQKLGWLQQRQVTLAQNIANLSTPGYVPQDAPDFASTLHNAAGSLTRTNPRHLAAMPLSGKDLLQKQQVAPDGNAVTMEDELMKVADTESQARLSTAIYREYLNMFSLALGHSTT